MSEAPTRMDVRAYSYRFPIADTVSRRRVALLEVKAIQAWAETIGRDGFEPYGEPVTVLATGYHSKVLGESTPGLERAWLVFGMTKAKPLS